MEVRTTTAEHVVPEGRVHLLGAVETVTGAMTLAELDGARVLLDAGVAQGAEARGWRVPDEAHRVDAVVLTHGHNDHVGSLPTLLERGFAGPILGTAATLQIARIVLVDGMRLNDVPASERVRVLKRFDAQQRSVPYDRLVRPLDGRGPALAFREAGHILGSASVELRASESRVIVSGDLGRPDTPILRDYHEAWEPGAPVDLAVVESTYGGREHGHSHDDVQRRLERILNDAIDRGGHVLVPAFAIGRTQTLLWHLNALVEAGRVRGLPVAVDTPMGLAVTETYAHFEPLYDPEALARIGRGDEPLDFEHLYAVRRGRDSHRLREVPGPMLVVAGSGMCTGGRIVRHLKELLPRDTTTLLFVGHQARGTPGRRIQDAARRGEGWVRIDGEDVGLRAAVATLSGLSAHADRAELTRWVRAIPDVRAVALHHGEPGAQHALARALAT
ncbi:MAG TPA: MBL fold metallo-hydrolase [Sandaracinaceae bacterium LLY-WYZ-13_1]|nr:MBL fold metallo-hydrolase [Sandaracinaceae bacterium LLY-WYZ-13_1]